MTSVDLTKEEITMILHALQIASEDGSIYGANANNNVIDQRIDAIEAKLRTAMRDRRTKKNTP